MAFSVLTCYFEGSHLASEPVDFSPIEYQVLPHELITARDDITNNFDLQGNSVQTNTLKIRAATRHVTFAMNCIWVQLVLVQYVL